MQVDRKGFVPELESCRGLAALMVAGGHAIYSPALVDGAELRVIKMALASDSAFVANAAALLRTLCNAHGAVLFFFVLSGFVLTASLDRVGPPSLRSAAHFCISRICRIYPAVFFMVAVFWLWWLLTGRSLGLDWYDWSIAAKSALLIEKLVNGVTWTMQTEMLGIPLVLGAFVLARRWSPAWIPVLALATLWFSYQQWWLDLVPAIGAYPRTKFLYCFLFGASVYWYGPPIVRQLRDTGSRIALVVAILIFVGLGEIEFTDTWRLYLHIFYRNIVESAASAVIVMCLAYGPGGFISRVLVTRPLRFLGRISYSLYLMHPLTLTVIWFVPITMGSILAAGVPLMALALLLAVGSCLAVIPLAWVSYRFVEIPGIRFGRWLMSAPLSRPVAQPTAT